MQSIFNTETYNHVLSRIEKLYENTPANWGKMNVSQMIWHCQGPLNIMLQKEDYGLKPNWLAKVFFKKSLYSDSIWRKNLPTAKFLKVTEDKDFKKEKSKLLELIKEAHTNRTKTDWEPHPGFGAFTPSQWGQMQYKHLDHHLRQFGV